MSDIVCCFVHFYIVSADCMDRIALDEIGENRRTGDLIRQRGIEGKEGRFLENVIAIWLFGNCRRDEEYLCIKKKVVL